ncbi:FmdB family transcriptional regulator [Ilumatobacter sp.]|uniref:FmdB family zinc ribbon protein n=1 Tax=Ilumatobacter sp. TaxID=1967498 RepID=UPI0037530CC9
MPTYVYKFVETGETIEIQQSFKDDTLTEVVHPDSGDTLAVKKVFQPVGVTFKGSGFFKNDNRGKTSTTTPAGSTSSDSSNGSSSESSNGSSSSPSSDSSKSSSTDSSKSSSTDSSKSSSTDSSKSSSTSTKTKTKTAPSNSSG